MLSLLVFLPIASIPFFFLLSASHKLGFKHFALVISLLQLAIAMLIFSDYDPSLKNTLTEKYSWIEISTGEWGIFKVNYHLALDSLNILMVLLCVLIQPLALLASWKVTEKPLSYFVLLAILNTSLLGSFLAQDFFLFYLFYEMMLIPMYFLIGIWGGEKRLYASLKFFLYTLFGSLFMLLVMVGMHFSYYETISPEVIHTFDFTLLSNPNHLIKDSFFANTSIRFWGFLGLFVAFAVKLPLVPLHTWLPDAHVQASTPISVLLASLLLKVGGYGLVRMCWGFFPDIAIAYAPYWAGLAVISVIYGGLSALAQKDLKRMIAYSSVGHMGFVLLGISAMTATALNGAIYQMFTHGLISSMLFLCVGILHDRVHNYQIENFRGLWNGLPIFSLFAFLAFFAGMGLPGLPAFVSELLIFAGAFQSDLISPYWIIASVFGILLSAGYFIWTIQRMFMGKYEVMGGSNWKISLTDLSVRELIIFIPLALLILWAGLYPQSFLGLIDTGVAQWIMKLTQ